MKKVILAVAPVGADDHDIQPIPLAEDIAACAKAGATFLHLHPLKKDGTFDPAADHFDTVVREVLKRTDIIIEGSTGSPEVPINDRFRVMRHQAVSACTFTAGNVEVPGKGLISTLPEEMRAQRDLVNQLGLCADFQIFTREHLENIEKINAEKPFLPKPIYNLVYTNEKEHPVPARRVIEDIARLPEGSIFGAIDCAAANMNLLMTSVVMGAAFVRVGFEDCRALGNGAIAQTNAELVKLAAFLIRQAGAEVATLEEARTMLNITR